MQGYPTPNHPAYAPPYYDASYGQQPMYDQPYGYQNYGQPMYHVPPPAYNPEPNKIVFQVNSDNNSGGIFCRSCNRSTG